MVKYFFLVSLFLYFNICLTSQVKVIFDTDLGGDADDLGALAMLHHYQDEGKCDILGVMCWSTEEFSVPAIDAVNSYYGHPDIPIGVRKGGSHRQEWNYGKPIADQFPHQLTYETAQDATSLYRSILSRQKDNTVVIVAVGPLKNIELLLDTPADDISPLSGYELIHHKVKEFVIMGGKYPSGEWEWNFSGNMPGVTQNVINRLNVPITFSGYEVGEVIKTGEVFNDIDQNTPLYAGFMHFSQNASWIKENFEGKILDNATYDQTAILYAVEGGVGQYWKRIYGKCIPDEEGGNSWNDDPGGDHAYLKLIVPPEEMAVIIEHLMLGSKMVTPMEQNNMLTASTINQFEWINKPEEFFFKENALVITTKKGTDFFNNPEDGNATGTAPFLYQEVEGDFVAIAKVEPDFASIWNACALMVHIDSSHWIKFAFENSDATGKSIVNVVTRGVSDDANGVVLDNYDLVWLKLVRKENNYAMHWSIDGKTYKMARLSSLSSPPTVKVGLEAQSPVGEMASHQWLYFNIEKKTVKDLRKGI